MTLRRVLGFGETVSIDRGVFWLHYKYTVIILCFLSAVIACMQFFGSPIECSAKTALVNNQCWNYRMYTKSSKNLKLPHADDGRTYVKGYQSYFFVLLLQALGFVLPRVLWSALEGRLMFQLSWRLKHTYLHPEVRSKTTKQIVEYIHIHMRRNSFYLFFYIVCEVLCLLNCVAQLVVANHYLNGVFGLFPQEVFALILSGQEDRNDGLSTTFVRTTWCQYSKPGTSDTLNTTCSLRYNSFNELVCTFVWYWTVVVTAVTSAVLLYHILEMAIPRLRLFAMKRQARLLDRACMEKVFLDAGLGDWFLLTLLCRNLDPIHLDDVFRSLAEDIGKSPLENILVCYPSTQVVDRVQRSPSLK